MASSALFLPIGIPPDSKHPTCVVNGRFLPSNTSQGIAAYEADSDQKMPWTLRIALIGDLFWHKVQVQETTIYLNKRSFQKRASIEVIEQLGGLKGPNRSLVATAPIRVRHAAQVIDDFRLTPRSFRELEKAFTTHDDTNCSLPADHNARLIAQAIAKNSRIRFEELVELLYQSGELGRNPQTGKFSRQRNPLINHSLVCAGSNIYLKLSRESLFERKLGKGTYKDLYPAVDMRTGETVALAVIGRRAPDPGIATELAIAQEFAGDDHFALVRHSVQSRKRTYYIMTLYENGSVESFLSKERRPWRVRHQFAQDLADGVAAMHARTWLHCDITPSNTLVDDQLRARLADFGLSERGTAAKGFPRPVMYMAPEATDSRNILTPQSDIFSLGVAFWEIFSAPPRWLFESNESCYPSDLAALDRELTVAGLTEEPLRGLLRAMMHPDPDQRIPITQVQSRLAAI